MYNSSSHLLLCKETGIIADPRERRGKEHPEKRNWRQPLGHNFKVLSRFLWMRHVYNFFDKPIFGVVGKDIPWSFFDPQRECFIFREPFFESLDQLWIPASLNRPDRNGVKLHFLPKTETIIVLVWLILTMYCLGHFQHLDWEDMCWEESHLFQCIVPFGFDCSISLH